MIASNEIPANRRVDFDTTVAAMALTAKEMNTLWQISTTGLEGYGRKYFLPLTATYSMRMQSNFYRKWLMHQSPSWTL